MQRTMERTDFGVLSEENIGSIHEKTLVLLEEVGVQILHPKARSMLEEIGTKTSGNAVVRIPSRIVERAIETCPRSIDLYDRQGNLCMVLDGKRTYYGGPSDSFFILDRVGRKRRFRLTDVGDVARVFDALPNMHFIHSVGLLPKEKPETAPFLAFRECYKNTTKPICFLANEPGQCSDIIGVCTRISGGREHLRTRPFIFHYSEPISPLLHTEAGIEKMLLCADSFIPLVYMPYCLMGGTSPMTAAGALVQCNAEVLSGLVIQQARAPGAPFIYGTMPAPIDMRTTTGLYGAPELHLAIAASRQIARSYRIPFFGTAGTSDSKHLDDQAVMEAVMSCLLTGLSHPDLAHDVGFLDHSNIISPELIVLTNEIIDMVKPLTRGVPVTEETLAVDLIRKVGLGRRSYVEEEHTYNHFREIWYPELLDRSMEGETPELNEKVRAKLNKILKDHRPESISKEAAAILNRLIP